MTSNISTAQLAGLAQQQQLQQQTHQTQAQQQQSNLLLAKIEPGLNQLDGACGHLKPSLDKFSTESSSQYLTPKVLNKLTTAGTFSVLIFYKSMKNNV